MSSSVHLALVFHVFIAAAVMVMVCGHCGLWPSWFVAVMISAREEYNNNNNNNLIYIAPACRMTSEALADSSSRATECLTEK